MTAKKPGLKKSGLKKPGPVKIFVHRRGRDPESGWCSPLEQAHRYRMDNILFLHATPIYDDVVEARPSRAYDDALLFKRVVKPGGRYAMILDYPEAAQFKKLCTFLRQSFDIVSEGCYGPSDDEPGRLYLAVPKRHTAKKVYTAACAEVPGLIAVHPELRVPGAKKAAPAPKKATRTKATRKKATTKGPPNLFDAILRNDTKAIARIRRKDLATRDEHGRSLLFMAILGGRTKLVEKLIALGANVDPKGPKDLAPLLAAALRNRPREAEMLLAAGARPGLARDKDGDPVLVTAAFREATAVVRALCALPHEPEHMSLALLEAAGVGNLPIVKLLVEHGADPYWVSRRGNSAMSIARRKRKREVVAYFKSLAG